MMVRPVCLDAGDAVELGELLGFLVGWLDWAGDRVAGSFGGFVGDGGYDLDGLRADLARFVFLLGGDDGEMQFSDGEQ
jgi:hypothetical protein